MIDFSILNSGIPYRSNPPILSARSYTTTVCPARVSCCAAARPAGPDPTTATVLPDNRSGINGTTRFSKKASSIVRSSTCLMVTASALIATTQAVSQGAGHNLPVNSGKLLVACNLSIASTFSPRQIKSFHSGIKLPSGQPWWQNGTPQSMHLPACFCKAVKS